MTSDPAGQDFNPFWEDLCYETLLFLTNSTFHFAQTGPPFFTKVPKQGQSYPDDPFHFLPVQLAVPILVVHLEGPSESVFKIPPQDQVKRRHILQEVQCVVLEGHTTDLTELTRTKTSGSTMKSSASFYLVGVEGVEDGLDVEGLLRGAARHPEDPLELVQVQSAARTLLHEQDAQLLNPGQVHLLVVALLLSHGPSNGGDSFGF